MIVLSMSGQHLLAGRIIVATVTPLDRYKALRAAGLSEVKAQGVAAGLITIKTA